MATVTLRKTSIDDLPLFAPNLAEKKVSSGIDFIQYIRSFDDFGKITVEEDNRKYTVFHK